MNLIFVMNPIKSREIHMIFFFEKKKLHVILVVYYIVSCICLFILMNFYFFFIHIREGSFQRAYHVKEVMHTGVHHRQPTLPRKKKVIISSFQKLINYSDNNSKIIVSDRLNNLIY